MRIKSWAVVLCLLLAGSAAWANDWPHFRGPNGDNSVPEAKIAKSFPTEGPKIAWRIDVNVGYGGAAVVGDEVFILDRVPDERDLVKSLSLADGSENWSWGHDVPGRISHPGSRMVPTVTGDTVYATSGFGHVYAVDRATHEQRWVIDVMKTYGTEAPQFGYAVQPVIYKDLCIIAPIGKDVGVVAVNRMTGEEVWRTGPTGGSQSSPILVELLGTEMITMPGAADGKVMLSGFDPASGRELFQYAEEMRGGAIPNITVIDESRFFITGSLGFGSQFFKIGRSESGEFGLAKTGSIPVGSTAQPGLKVGERIYITGAADRRAPEGSPSGLICMDFDANVIWSSGNEPSFGQGNLIDAGGVIVTQDGGDGTLRLVEPGDTFKLLAEGKVFGKETGNELWAPMALAGTKLFMRSQNELVCVDLAP